MSTFGQRLSVLLVLAIGARASAHEPGGTVRPAAGTGQARATDQAALYSHYTQTNLQLPPINGPAYPPPDPNGAARLHQPTPVGDFAFQTGHPVAYNTNPDAKTTGIRLDDSYGLLREIEEGSYISEYQFVQATGATVLPFQSPCWLIGLRGMADYVSNNSVTSDAVGTTLDLYTGTRYKATYLKFGYLWDWQDHYDKMGFTFSAMTNWPIVHNLTFDMATSFGSGADRFGPERDTIFRRLRRVEVADDDVQIRVGKFLTPTWQVGWAGTLATYQFSDDEFSSGLFSQSDFGRTRVGIEFAVGDMGARGFVTVGFSWGAHPDKHPRDVNYGGIDTVAWVTRPTLRDISVRLRDTFTGPLPRNP